MEFILVPIGAMFIMGLPIVIAEAVYNFFSDATSKITAFFSGVQL